MPTLDSRLVKLSRSRLVVSGDSFELYQYARPFSYNWPPLRRSASADESASETLTGERRADNVASARRALRRLITANGDVGRDVRGTTGTPHMVKFITYTFARNVCDYAEAMSYWTQYARRLRERFGPQKYIAVIEFQKRGAVHYHVLHYSIPYIPGLKNIVADLWGQGFIKIKALKKIRSVAAYVSKYLRKAKIDGRLSQKKAFFCSRGLKRPVEYRNHEQVAEVVASGILQKEKSHRFPSERFGEIIYSWGKVKNNGFQE